MLFILVASCVSCSCTMTSRCGWFQWSFKGQIWKIIATPGLGTPKIIYGHCEIMKKNRIVMTTVYNKIKYQQFKNLAWHFSTHYFSTCLYRVPFLGLYTCSQSNTFLQIQQCMFNVKKILSKGGLRKTHSLQHHWQYKCSPSTLQRNCFYTPFSTSPHLLYFHLFNFFLPFTIF